MNAKRAIVVTSISNSTNRVLQELAQGSKSKGYQFIVIGDEASPSEFHLDGCDFYSLERQKELRLEFANLCPKRHYARKNIGYLIAIQCQASIIIETDDDNIPYETFWKEQQRQQNVPHLSQANWVNVYRYFTENNIWPRGFPLQSINYQLNPSWNTLSTKHIDCPIQQGLANDNPDVDAIYRLVLPLPQTFRMDRRVALTSGTWCPFNSQNTTWWSDAYPLMYLPSYCSFRMTDIWRSFVAQRIAWTNNWGILFHEPTVWQDRNQHNLLRDFQDEIPGYLHNHAICEALASLNLISGVDKLDKNLRICYEKLVSMSLIDSQELKLLDAWLNDLAELRQKCL
ncbi:STELLO glycosyltransferase family protein [Coleofasciculus chthonoplastes]|uniref:STELLO glycosyltransferase family protein n=1 Tax=Coleofasciculus chthonoplastes TaxID=64178 RepID=UPI0032FE33D6